MFTFGGSSGPQEHNFTNTNQVVINHNLGYKPLVYVVTNEGELSFCQVDYNSDNQVTLTFQNSLTGVAYIR
tara:strand:- start:319 stop:531 length:213 start_codon:yes stop_codon:yes gene_type:complete